MRVVRRDARAILIDFGSGDVLDHLAGIGISRVDWVLHTHHHRDQCQGDARAVAAGIPIAVPAHERHLFEDVEAFWRTRRVFHQYAVRNDFNSLVSSVPVSASLRDDEMFLAGEIPVMVVPTPGHTMGSVTLLVEVDAQRVAFSGDLVYAPGKILTLFDLQVRYSSHEGLDLGAQSLDRLADLSPDIVCPSHGNPMPDPSSALRATAARLAEFWAWESVTPPGSSRVATRDSRPYRHSDHLIVSHQTESCFYALVSETGKAMLIDYGQASWTAFGAFEAATGPTDRMRFVAHTIGVLERDFGITAVDVVMPTHVHDDHTSGIPYLARHYGTQVWALDLIADVLENPRGWNLGCLLGEAIPVDRRLSPGERFTWEEFEFVIEHSPGHAEHEMALFVVVDCQWPSESPHRWP